jgi:hypothetical protein
VSRERDSGIVNVTCTTSAAQDATNVTPDYPPLVAIEVYVELPPREGRTRLILDCLKDTPTRVRMDLLSASPYPVQKVVQSLQLERQCAPSVPQISQ